MNKFDLEIFSPEGKKKFYNLTVHQVFHALRLYEIEFGRAALHAMLYIS